MMKKSNTATDIAEKNPDQSPLKATYNTPRLRVLGTVEEVTAAGGSGGGDTPLGYG